MKRTGVLAAIFAFTVFFIFSGCDNGPLKNPLDTGNGNGNANNGGTDISPPALVDGVLVADSTDPYLLIPKRGYNYEVPDNPDWGNHWGVKHITQVSDSFLKRPVFALVVHYDSDVKDTWMNSDERDKGPNDLLNSLQIDRQRNEIKTDANSPDWGKAAEGSNVVYRWKFKLPAGFVASAQFTHIHQLKAVDGDESQPIITVTVRKRTGSSQQEMQLIYNYSSDTGSNIYLIEKIPLDDFLDEWVTVEEKAVYSSANPAYEFTATRMRDGKELMHYIYNAAAWNESVPFRLIRPDNTFVRPKWGIYRQILRDNNGTMVEVTGPLRDETILFADFEIVPSAK
ncbi:MAG: hypothetical protein FWF29_01695 [Treponema sp.]|nr:hypothetical protein [Treponema sp.]